MNSTIVGQRKPKPNRRKKKKHSTDDRERRYSEGEASDYESKTDSCDDCKQKSTDNNSTNSKNGPAVTAQPKVNAKAGRVVDKQTKGPDIDKTGHLEFKNGLMFDIEI